MLNVNTEIKGSNDEENDILVKDINIIGELQEPIYDDIELLNKLSSKNFFRNANKDDLNIFFDYFNYILLNYVDKYFYTINNCIINILSQKVKNPNIYGTNYKLIINRGVSIIYYRNEIFNNNEKITDLIYQLAFFKDELYKIMELQKRNIERVLINFSPNEYNDIYIKLIKYWKNNNFMSIMTYKNNSISYNRINCFDQIYMYINRVYFNKYDKKMKKILMYS